MKKNIKKVQKRNFGNGSISNRGSETRNMILEAARKVFATHPYNAASIRMVAAQGDFYHGLLRYHFPNKASLFEAVVEDACHSLYNANKKWLTEVSHYPPAKGLSVYLNRFIDYFREYPEMFQIIVKSSSHDDPATLPGYHHLKALLADTRRDFENILPGLFSQKDVNRFLTGLNALILHFLGFSSMEAEIIGFPGPDENYLRWVKETLYFIFLPVLEKTVSVSAKADK
ncbi:MAG: TetR/AcrR family transcriptional regulator [Syntrophaceae bacterium]|nr:TetR/AcrR family transcriptional regulator [Syntrophaceae bacterium]